MSRRCIFGGCKNEVEDDQMHCCPSCFEARFPGYEIFTQLLKIEKENRRQEQKLNLIGEMLSFILVHDYSTAAYVDKKMTLISDWNTLRDENRDEEGDGT